jgi:hypothetical protein
VATVNVVTPSNATSTPASASVSRTREVFAWTECCGAFLIKVDPDQVHVAVSASEEDIVVDTLRSVGTIEIADRFERILWKLARGEIARPAA